MLRIGISGICYIRNFVLSIETSLGEKRYFTKIFKWGIVTPNIPKRNDIRKFPRTFSHSLISCTWYIVSRLSMRVTL